MSSQDRAQGGEDLAPAAAGAHPCKVEPSPPGLIGDHETIILTGRIIANSIVNKMDIQCVDKLGVSWACSPAPALEIAPVRSLAA